MHLPSTFILQVFPLIFACLSPKIMNMIPGALNATLQEIAVETKAKITITENKAWMYGSLSDITHVERELAKLEAQVAEEIIEEEIQDESEEEEEEKEEDTSQSLEEIVKCLVGEIYITQQIRISFIA